jgi:hypothetical protein
MGDIPLSKLTEVFENTATKLQQDIILAERTIKSKSEIADSQSKEMEDNKVIGAARKIFGRFFENSATKSRHEEKTDSGQVIATAEEMLKIADVIKKARSKLVGDDIDYTRGRELEFKKITEAIDSIYIARLRARSRNIYQVKDFESKLKEMKELEEKLQEHKKIIEDIREATQRLESISEPPPDSKFDSIGSRTSLLRQKIKYMIREIQTPYINVTSRRDPLGIIQYIDSYIGSCERNSSNQEVRSDPTMVLTPTCYTKVRNDPKARALSLSLSSSSIPPLESLSPSSSGASSAPPTLASLSPSSSRSSSIHSIPSSPSSRSSSTYSIIPSSPPSLPPSKPPPSRRFW